LQTAPLRAASVPIPFYLIQISAITSGLDQWVRLANTDNDHHGNSNKHDNVTALLYTLTHAIISTANSTNWEFNNCHWYSEQCGNISQKQKTKQNIKNKPRQKQLRHRISYATCSLCVSSPSATPATIHKPNAHVNNNYYFAFPFSWLNFCLYHCQDQITPDDYQNTSGDCYML